MIFKRSWLLHCDSVHLCHWLSILHLHLEFTWKSAVDAALRSLSTISVTSFQKRRQYLLRAKRKTYNSFLDIHNCWLRLFSNTKKAPLLTKVFFTVANAMDKYDDDRDEVDDCEDETHTLTYSCIMAPNRCTKRFLNISDSIIAIVIVTPLVVGHWLVFFFSWFFFWFFVRFQFNRNLLGFFRCVFSFHFRSTGMGRGSLWINMKSIFQQCPRWCSVYAIIC